MSTERLLLDIAIIFIAAKASGALFERMKQPPVIGELLAGILLGPHLIGALGHTDTHEVLQALGAIVLLFAVGMDTPLADLRVVADRSLGVGGAGVVIPFAAGFALIALATGQTYDGLYIGAAMVATSVGVTARVLADLGRVREPESRVILGAAVIDDILGLLVLSVVVGSFAGTLTVGSVVLLALIAIGFVIVVGGIGPAMVGRARPMLDKMGEYGPFSVAMGLCLALAAFAGAIELAAIIGAFLAGMAFAETRDRYSFEQQLGPIYHFLVPFFFVITGTLVDLRVFLEPKTAILGAAVFVVATVGKLVGCGLASLSMGVRSATIVGVGMVPRGEVGIIVATLGLSQGVIGADLYGIVVAMSVLTTLFAPPMLTWLFRGRPERKVEEEKLPTAHTPEIQFFDSDLGI